MSITDSIVKVLTFRATKEDMLAFRRPHLIAGIAGTWIVGMGRYWDDPGAQLLQKAGLGSVIYIFVLAAFIWLILWPLNIKNLRYFTILTFISLTSFPAILYAVPIEWWVDLDTANQVNALFLGIVALWRLALLYVFLKRYTGMSHGGIIVISLMPVCVIIAVLTVLNLHRVVFNVMGGFRRPTAHDSSYYILYFLTTLSVILVIPLLLSYIITIVRRRLKIKRANREEIPDTNVPY